MADSSPLAGLSDRTVEVALEAYDHGYRIIAGWFNKAFDDWEIGVHIEADPPPEVTLDDCRRNLSNALLGIRPLCPNLPPDDQLYPWAVGYLRMKDKNPGDVVGGIGLRANPLSPWDSAEAVKNIIALKYGKGWKDAEWRAYVVEPMEENANLWRGWLQGFHSSKAGAGDGAHRPDDEQTEPVAESLRKSVVLFGRHDKPIVKDSEKDKLTKAQYNVLLVLLKAGKKGLTKDDLDRESNHGDARKILKRLADSDPDWASVISFAGKTGGGYRIP